jgi:L-cysteine S-thiosulfotransferase
LAYFPLTEAERALLFRSLRGGALPRFRSSACGYLLGLLMPGQRRRTSTALGLFLGIGVAVACVFSAYAAECKRKTAGYFLQFTHNNGAGNLREVLNSIPESLTGALGDPERGREVLTNAQKGGCLNCHKVSALSAIPNQGGVGPALDGAGSRYNDAQLRQLIVDPKAYFPATIMPSYYKQAGGPEASVLTAANVEDLVAYLRTLK